MGRSFEDRERRMEVYFVDIGKGTSNLILLGGSRAIVIDCGKSSGILLQLLAKFRVEEIVRLVVSHNHDDHVGGAVGILTEYEGRIGKICCLEDGELHQTNLWRKIEQQRRAGIITYDQLLRLECDDSPKMLYQERARKLSLKIFSPRYGDNLQAIGEGDQNATSAVLVLDIEDKRIVFAGDSTIRQWRRIREARGRPIDCEILAVAHHGGIVWDDPNELMWLYKEGILPRVAIISVATSNTDKHPRPEVVQAMAAAGAKVMCTQITRRCCDDLEPLRPGVLTPHLPCRSRPDRDLTGAGNSRNVACAGTIVAEFARSELTIHRIADHQAGVDRLAASAVGHPLCR
jgi:beta-lactamase superfamily II metal-dependent hydrolase